MYINLDSRVRQLLWVCDNNSTLSPSPTLLSSVHLRSPLCPALSRLWSRLTSASPAPPVFPCSNPSPFPIFTSLRTILLSVISLLNEPNTFSPANVDASVMYRKWRESKGNDKEYIELIRCHKNSTLRTPTSPISCLFLNFADLSPPYRKQVQATKAEAERDGVKVPVTLDEYCIRTQVPPTDDGSNLLYDDCYDDEELEDDDEDDDEDCCYDEDDSGTEDS